MTTKLLTAAEVAERLRTNMWFITSECRAGRLKASKPAKQWLISEAAVDAYLEANTPAAAQTPTTSRRRKRRAS